MCPSKAFELHRFRWLLAPPLTPSQNSPAGEGMDGRAFRRFSCGTFFSSLSPLNTLRLTLHTRKSSRRGECLRHNDSRPYLAPLAFAGSMRSSVTSTLATTSFWDSWRPTHVRTRPSPTSLRPAEKKMIKLSQRRSIFASRDLNSGVAGHFFFFFYIFFPTPLF